MNNNIEIKALNFAVSDHADINAQLGNLAFYTGDGYWMTDRLPIPLGAEVVARFRATQPAFGAYDIFFYRHVTNLDYTESSGQKRLINRIDQFCASNSPLANWDMLDGHWIIIPGFFDGTIEAV